MTTLGRIVACVLFLLSAAQACDPSKILKVDAVELVRGKEVAGQESIFADHYRYRYQFANEQNKAEFVAHPEKYEIQLGGACGRMGALSGAGDVNIFATHESRVYIFASESCKKTFLAAPAKVLDRPDVIPSGTEDAKKKGGALIERAVEAMGGATRVDSVKSYQRRLEQKSEHQGKTVSVVDMVTIEFPDRVRTDYTWDTSRYTKVVNGGDAWEETPTEVYPLHEQQREALHRQQLNRNLLMILRSRHQSGFVAVHEGAKRIDHEGQPIDVENVAVAVNGCVCTLGIDPKTGRILTQTYRGQGPRATFGTVERTLTNFETIDGITYPKSSRVRFDGNDLEKASDDGMSVAFDVKLDADFFERPKH